MKQFIEDIIEVIMVMTMIAIFCVAVGFLIFDLTESYHALIMLYGLVSIIVFGYINEGEEQDETEIYYVIIR